MIQATYHRHQNNTQTSVGTFAVVMEILAVAMKILAVAIKILAVVMEILANKLNVSLFIICHIFSADFAVSNQVSNIADYATPNLCHLLSYI